MYKSVRGEGKNHPVAIAGLAFKTFSWVGPESIHTPYLASSDHEENAKSRACLQRERVLPTADSLNQWPGKPHEAWSPSSEPPSCSSETTFFALISLQNSRLS